MGVGDYVHAKEGDDQLYRAGGMDDIWSYQKRQGPPAAEGAGRITTQVSLPRHMPLDVEDQQQHLHQHKGAFDTDVEGVDDSTITVTTTDDSADRHFVNAAFAQHFENGSANSDFDQSEAYYEGEGPENELYSPASTGDGVEDDADDEDTEILDWAHTKAGAHRPADLSKTTPKQGNPSRIPKAHSMVDMERIGTEKVPAATRFASMDNRADQVLPYRNGHRMNSYSQSLATTPKNRFNFKTERPYERLILQSPTRRASGPRPQPGRQNSTASLHGANPPAEQRKTFYDGPPPDHKIRSTLDATDDEGLDETASSVDVHISSNQSRQEHAFEPDQNRFESDYPPEVLQQIPFSDLEREPFDHIPSSPHPPLAVIITPKKISCPPSPHPPPKPPKQQTAAEKLAYAQALPTEADRHGYLSGLSLTEWEDFGDQIIADLASMLTKTKEARQARRKTAAVFEAEIKRRHEETEKQDAELDKKLAEMKEGGLGVLRGASPT